MIIDQKCQIFNHYRFIVQKTRISESIPFISNEESFPCISIDSIYVYLKMIDKTQFAANFSNLPDVLEFNSRFTTLSSSKL